MSEGEDRRDDLDETFAQALQRLKKATLSERIEAKLETSEIPFDGFDEGPRGKPRPEQAG